MKLESSGSTPTGTVLYARDQEEAMIMSDRVCLMNNSRIDQIGSPADLYFRPHSVFAADFIGESNLLAAEVAGIDGDEVTPNGAAGALLRARLDAGRSAAR
jgi:putative spermidine/putrescine transport system ATP-binding protein